MADSIVNGNHLGLIPENQKFSFTVKKSEDDLTAEPTMQNEEEEHDPQFAPIISLPEVKLPTLEEDEEELVKLRAKLFRYDSSESPSEWKERGTGEVKLLRHKEKHSVRVLMRRDKTLKICANHFVTPVMELKPNCGSDKAWVWSVVADFADEVPKPELLAIKFGNAENAKKFKDAFEEAKNIVSTKCKIYTDPMPSDSDDDEGYDKVDDSESDEENNSTSSQSKSSSEALEATEAALKKLALNKEKEPDTPDN